ncbi:WD40/YVTN/BNR-like repeat-containing protein [Patescibacteria group bacterium]
MKKIFKFITCFCLFLVGVFIFTPFVLATWSSQTSGVAVALNDIDMVDVNNGWAVGDAVGGNGVILNTTDGGQTWNRQTGGVVPNVNLNGVSAVDANTAWVVGDALLGMGIVLYTINGGTTWAQQNGGVMPLPNADLHDVAAVDANTAWAVGDFALPAETIMYTTDAGANWNNQGAPVVIDLYGVDAASSSYAWTVGQTGGAAGTIYYTNNAGANWNGQAGAPNVNLNDITYGGGDPTAGDAALWITGDSDGANGVILYTDDNGANWTQQNGTIPNVNLHGASAIDEDIVWSVGASDGVNGVDLKTRNNGALWSQQTESIPNVALNGVSAVNAANIWVVGAGGTIVKYSDTTAPAMVLNAITTPTTDTTPTFTGTASDYDGESAVPSVEYRIDSGSWNSASITGGGGTSDVTYQFTLAALTSGSHTVDSRGTDAEANTTTAGNYATQTFTISSSGTSGDGDDGNDDGSGELVATGLVQESRFNFLDSLILSFVISVGSYLALIRIEKNLSFLKVPFLKSKQKKRVYTIQF